MLKALGPYLFAAVLVTLLLRLAPPALNHLGPDSIEYLEFASDLASGQLMMRQDLSDIKVGTLIRTPGYPLLLALGQTCFPDNLRSAVLFGNALVTVATTIAIFSVCGTYIRAVRLSMILLIVDIFNTKFFAAIAAEWFASQLLILLFAFAIRYYYKRTTRVLAAITFICSALILIRPALTSLLAMPPVLLLLMPKKQWRCSLMTLMLGTLPVLLWMGFNDWRLGQMTISPSRGAAKFHLGFVLGSPKPEAEDSDTYKTFAQLFDERRVPWDETILTRTDNLRDGAIEVYRANFEVAYAIRKERGISWLELYSLMNHFGDEARKQFVPRYRQHLINGLVSCSDTLVLILFWAVLAAYRDRFQFTGGDLFASAIMLGVHIMHISSILIITPLNTRYCALTFSTAGMSLLSLVAAHFEYARDRGARRV